MAVEKKTRFFGVNTLGLRAGLLITALWIPGAHAADSLPDALVKAYNTNPQLMSERANLRAADEEVAQAIALWRPRISINGKIGRAHV